MVGAAPGSSEGPGLLGDGDGDGLAHQTVGRRGGFGEDLRQKSLGAGCKVIEFKIKEGNKTISALNGVMLDQNKKAVNVVAEKMSLGKNSVPSVPLSQESFCSMRQLTAKCTYPNALSRWLFTITFYGIAFY